jgi:hypothetical protein
MTAAAHVHIDAAISDVWRDCARGLITDSEAEHRTALLAGQRGPPRPIGRQLRAALTLTKFAPRRYQRSPDREASRKRRTVLGACGLLPPAIREEFGGSLAQMSVLTVIALECRRNGRCDWPQDKIAATAGVCRTMVKNAKRKAAQLGLLMITPRPLPGRRNLTDVVEIISSDWLEWLGRIGVKTLAEDKIVSPTKTSFDDAADDGTAKAIAREIAALAGIDIDAAACPPHWREAPKHVASWLKAGQHPELIMLGTARAMRRRSQGAPCSPAYFLPQITTETQELRRLFPGARLDPNVPLGVWPAPVERQHGIRREYG